MVTHTWNAVVTIHWDMHQCMATHKDASWAYNAGFTWLSCQYWRKRGPFFKFQLLVTQPQSLYRVCNTFHQWKAKVGWLVTWYILMQYKLILFMMSHTQNTRHKRALLMAMIVLLKTISFEQTKPHWTEKSAVNVFFIPLLSTGLWWFFVWGSLFKCSCVPLDISYDCMIIISREREIKQTNKPTTTTTTCIVILHYPS